MEGSGVQELCKEVIEMMDRDIEVGRTAKCRQTRVGGWGKRGGFSGLETLRRPEKRRGGASGGSKLDRQESVGSSDTGL